MTKLLNKTTHKRFNNTETLLLFSSIGSSIAAIVFQQITFAVVTSVPLSLAISLNSSNRRRLDEAIQRHQSSITHLEQQFLTNRDSVNQVLYSLVNHDELANVKSILENHNIAFTKQLNELKKQLNAHLELQQNNNLHSEFVAVQQRLNAVESSLESYNLAHLHTKLQETVISVEGKIKKLEQQFYNLPLFDIQHRITQSEQLIKQLKESSIDFTHLHKYFLGETQSKYKDKKKWQTVKLDNS